MKFKSLVLALMLCLFPVAVFAGNTATWVDNSNNETNFVLERKAVACATALPAFGVLVTLPANTVTYVDNAVTEGVTYCYRVKATNAAGDSAYSNTADRLVPFTVPASPSLLNVN